MSDDTENLSARILALEALVTMWLVHYTPADQCERLIGELDVAGKDETNLAPLSPELAEFEQGLRRAMQELAARIRAFQAASDVEG